jgi:predicted HicB family RNase H-like nuclease
MNKQTTVRLPEDLADQAEVIARAQGTSVNQVLIDGLLLEIERVKADQEFMATLERLVARDKEILDRLAQ